MNSEKTVKTLRPYQVADLAFYIREGRCLNLSDPGTGKTPSVCVYAQYLWDHCGEKSVWAMPKSLLKKNLLELLDFTTFENEDLAIVDGPPAKRDLIMRDSRVKVFLMGFDAYARNWKTLKDYQPELSTVLVDEIHMGFGGSTSKRTQEFWRSLERQPGRLKNFVGMTGTIVDGKLSSAFPSIQVINPLYYGDYDNFKNQHAITDDYGNVVAWYNTEKIKMILGRHAIRHSFEEVYGAEKKVIIPEVCEMSPTQAAAYLEFEEKAILELEDAWLDGTMDAVHAIRCRQIMAAPELFGIHSPDDLTGKDERLLIHLDHAKETGEPLVVFASMVPEQERIFRLVTDRMKMKAGLINGSVSADKRAKIDQDFQAGRLQVIVGSPATAAVGFNWSRTRTMVFASLDYKDSNFVQGYRRAIRGHREDPLLIYVLQYDTKVERRILEIVEQKSRLANKVDASKEVFRLQADKPKPGISSGFGPVKKRLRMSDLR